MPGAESLPECSKLCNRSCDEFLVPVSNVYVPYFFTFLSTTFATTAMVEVYDKPTLWNNWRSISNKHSIARLTYNSRRGFAVNGGTSVSTISEEGLPTSTSKTPSWSQNIQAWKWYLSILCGLERESEGSIPKHWMRSHHPWRSKNEGLLRNT